MSLNSQDIQNIIAVIAVVTTFVIYSRRRIDARHDAARTILYEIEQAEDKFDDASRVIEAARSSSLHDRVQLIAQNSWIEARKQLINVLPSDVIKKINSFYNDAELLDISLRQIDETFIKNETEVRTNAFRVNADYFKSRVDKFVYEDEVTPKPDTKELDRLNNSTIADIERRRNFFNSEFTTLYAYAPKKPVEDGTNILQRLRNYNLSQSRVGDHLRNAATTRLSRLFSKSR